MTRPRRLSRREAMRMVTDIARVAYKVARDPQTPEGKRKHSTTSVAIALDKYLALRKAGSPEAPKITEQQREDVIELIRVIAASASDQAPAAPASEPPDPPTTLEGINPTSTASILKTDFDENDNSFAM